MVLGDVLIEGFHSTFMIVYNYNIIHVPVVTLISMYIHTTLCHVLHMQGSKLTFFPWAGGCHFLQILQLPKHIFFKHSYNISNMILNMFMIDAQYNDINIYES